MTTKNNRTVVVKVGTSSLTTPSGDIDVATVSSLAADISQLVHEGSRVMVVSSGAITAGWNAVGGGRPRPQDSGVLQAVAAVGQPLLMQQWAAAFSAHGHHTAQVLVAPWDFSHRSHYVKIRNTIDAVSDLGAIAIINENDAVTDDEIRFGDNDRIAALIANVMSADRLVLLTDTDGLLTSDPRVDPTASLIHEVRAFDDELVAMAGESASRVGSGGMASKLAAARIATWSGVSCVIAPAREPHSVRRSVDRDEDFGTYFHAREERLSARKAWIAFACPTRGVLRVNEGASHAVEETGASLLRVGVDAVMGDFEDGEAVEVSDALGRVVAKGLVRASSARWRDAEDVVIHRDDLVILRP
jgi:glutamate 5-kinase